MKKKMIAIAIAVVFILSQTGVAQAAFGIDEGPVVYTAEKDMSSVITTTSLVVTLENRSGTGTPTAISWVSATLGDGWTIADQYVVVDYASFETGWGVQLYTNNINNTDANHRFTGDPYETASRSTQPAGLVGSALVAGGTDKALPMAILVSPVVVAAADLEVPVEAGSGFGSGADYDGDPDTMLYSNYPGIDALWYYMKDKGNAYVSPNPAYDPDADPPDEDPPYLYLSDWEDADSMATIVNPDGAHAGVITQNETTWKISADDDKRNSLTNSLVNVYLAVNFGPATKQAYKTDTLSIELYHQ